MNINRPPITYFIAEVFTARVNHTDSFLNLPRPQFSFAYIERGAARFTDSDGNSFDIRAGDIVFVPKGMRYLSLWTGSPETLFYSCHFDVLPFSDPFGGRRFHIQVLRGFERLGTDFRCISENFSDRAAYLSHCAKFYNICTVLASHLESAALPPLDERIKKAAEYISARPSDKITVGFLADMCNLSIPHFHRLFRQSFGMTPIDYKNKKTVDLAMLMLLNNRDLSIEEVSSRLGFESSTYFRRIFKAYVGYTPTEYRRIAPHGM